MDLLYILLLLCGTVSAGRYLARVAQMPDAKFRFRCWNFYDEMYLCAVPTAEHLDALQLNVIIMETWNDSVVQVSECQQNAPWHLSNLNGAAAAPQQFGYSVPQPATPVYVLDTWVDIEHPDLQGRATRGPQFEYGESQYHGTHVAGLVASYTFGVNKNASVVSVQVLNERGQGRWSSILAGLDWVARQRRRGIVNLSIGGPKSQAINNVVEMMAQRKWKIVAAAGNEHQDACSVSPASSNGILTVGAYDERSTIATFSNYGKCVGIMAPGKNIMSLASGGGAMMMSGTSMAAPIVAGLWSLFPQLNRTELLVKYTASGKVTGQIFDTPNLSASLPDQGQCKPRGLRFLI